jgi:hypothetical protein
MRKPKIALKCPANVGTAPNERIIEFSCPSTPNDGNDISGGLINFRKLEDGKLYVCVYRTDLSVVVQVGAGVRWQLPGDGVCVGGPGEEDYSHLNLVRTYEMLDHIPAHVLREYLRKNHAE